MLINLQVDGVKQVSSHQGHNVFMRREAFILACIYIYI